jgi:hypothetical protein
VLEQNQDINIMKRIIKNPKSPKLPKQIQADFITEKSSAIPPITAPPTKSLGFRAPEASCPAQALLLWATPLLLAMPLLRPRVFSFWRDDHPSSGSNHIILILYVLSSKSIDHVQI